MATGLGAQVLSLHEILVRVLTYAAYGCRLASKQQLRVWRIVTSSLIRVSKELKLRVNELQWFKGKLYHYATVIALHEKTWSNLKDR